MVTRRTWRVFTLAAPSIQLNPLTDSVGSFGYGPDGKDRYPFSIKPDNKLSLVDIMKMTRDTFEGTPFDLSKGLGAGPFGDVMRYEAAPSTLDPVNGILYPNETDIAVRPERPISLYRTVYASIAQARRDLPDAVGAVVWISPYAPHHSSYVPVYTSADKTPSSISKGTQYKISKSSNYWVHSVVGNYLSRLASKSPSTHLPTLIDGTSILLKMFVLYNLLLNKIFLKNKLIWKHKLLLF